MALWMVMTGGVLVDAALESRLRPALQEQGATVPDRQGTRPPPPPARGGFHDVVGLQGRFMPQPWPIVLHLTAAHAPLLQRLGQREAWWYQGIFTHRNASVQKVRFMTSTSRNNHDGGAECRLLLLSKSD
jgi:hypothetical protein